eukprot:TRINITY_DN50123_c0_g1_i1.p1 TRINITY_DN50123_c0_g1~~TRINITY_DN50123_c0_g1_i1.p1  ORF type:complete len:221 (-),score=46.98 TRINITY_DN50123_c0_g1_i1:52-714(-)
MAIQVSKRHHMFSLVLTFASVPHPTIAKTDVADVCSDKGLFSNPKQDAVIPLCEDNYPSKNSKESFLILFYTQDQNKEVGKYFDVQLNKIAMDFGTFAVRGKFAAKGSAGKPKKHRKRIEFLADKYDFQNDLTLPEKGLTDKTPLVKVGGVCCDCALVPKSCPGESGLLLRLIHEGKEITLDQDVRKIPETVRGVLEAMGYVKLAEAKSEVFGVSENEEL